MSGAGVVDTSFAPNLNGPARALALRADGSWLVAGDFTQVNGTERQRLACLRADGALEESFTADIDGPVDTISLRADGSSYAGGAFSQAGGVPRPWLARLGAEGGLDAAFAPVLDGAVHAVCAVDDGGCLVGGDFALVNGAARPGIAKLHADGSLDTAFAPAVEMRCRAVLQRADGVVHVAGESLSAEGAWLPRLVLLQQDGSVLKDVMEYGPTIFSTYGQGQLRTLVPESDGKLYTGGDFEYIDYREGLFYHTHLARCSAPPSTHPRLGLSRSGKVLTWTRLGGLARLERVTFEAAGADGVWFPLGPGVRIGASHDWAISGLTLAPGLWQFRARGCLAGGSASWHELTTWLTVRGNTTAFDAWMEARHGLRAGDVSAAAPWGGASSGVSHLLAYAMGASPTLSSTPAPQQFPAAAKTAGGEPAFRFPRWTLRADVALTVQTTTDLTTGWVDIARSIGGSAFFAMAPEVDVDESTVEGIPSVTVTTPGLTQQQRFYRLAVTLLNP